MADRYDFTANVTTGGSGSTAGFSVTQTNVSIGSSVSANVVGGGVGPKGDKGDKGDTGTTDYLELINTPTLGTAAATDATDYATAAQGSRADTAVQPAQIVDFETTTQLNTRDTNNRSRSNHTGTQAISTVSGLQTALDGKQATGDYATNTALSAKANASDTVNLTGNQTIAGVKTFSSSPVVPTATTNTQAVNKGQMDAADALKLNISDNRVELRGTGFPNGVVSAPVGSTYIDTNATNGAIEWKKATGTGNTGWVVPGGSTIRTIQPEELLNGWAYDGGVPSSSYIRLMRGGNMVTLTAPRLCLNCSAATANIFMNIPTGYRIDHTGGYGSVGVFSDHAGVLRDVGSSFGNNLTCGVSGTWRGGTITWKTKDSWPTV